MKKFKFTDTSVIITRIFCCSAFYIVDLDAQIHCVSNTHIVVSLLLPGVHFRADSFCPTQFVFQAVTTEPPAAFHNLLLNEIERKHCQPGR